MITNIKYEKSLWDKGIKYIAGVDEVGRGPLAGPMVVCAVVLDFHRINDVQSIENSFYSEIHDSKVVSQKKREQLAEKIKNEAISYSIVRIESTEIDKFGLGQATQKAFYDSVMGLQNVAVEHVLTDAFPIRKMEKGIQTNLKFGDKLSISIAAASIVAKVYRDALMVEYHQKYPQYGFDQHKGYGTAKHMAALRKYGPCEIHRASFAPVKALLANN